MSAIGEMDSALDGGRPGVLAVRRNDLSVLELEGADVLRYLHSVSTQHTTDLRPGDATRALLLSPKGKIEFAFRMAVLEGGALLDTEVEAAGDLAERLARFVFRYDVKVRDTGGLADGGVAALSLLGDGAARGLEAAGLPAPPARDDRATLGDGLVVYRTEVGVDLVGARPGAADGAATALEAAGVSWAPLESWELARIERGVPKWGAELTDDVLAEEAGLLGSYVHMDKGCYPGQETVARVHNRGQVQRRLAGLRFDEPDDARAGDDGPAVPAARTDLLTEDGRRAGQVRSVVRHPRLGPIGLAYVRGAVANGARVLAGDLAASVMELPFQAHAPNREQSSPST
jgi:folate-binding protein YgfZ